MAMLRAAAAVQTVPIAVEKRLPIMTSLCAASVGAMKSSLDTCGALDSIDGIAVRLVGKCWICAFAFRGQCSALLHCTHTGGGKAAAVPRDSSALTWLN